MSSTRIPKKMQSLLQLGDNFNLPIKNKDKLTAEFIKNVKLTL